jgi:tRNA pseudouridine55 synthase
MLEPGFYLVHKPVGVTSFSLVRDLTAEAQAEGRGKFPVCHGGTLDPFAHGLVVLLAGQATRLIELLHPLPKVYEVEVAWGRETDTGDPMGRTVAEGSAQSLRPEALEAAVAQFLGFSLQVPPATCAKKIGGEPAYKKVHRGEAVALPPSRVYLHQARFLSHALPRSSRLWLRCRGGFYVRALVRDLGRIVGCPAHVGSLWRMAVGPYADPPPATRNLVKGEGLLGWCRSRALADAEADDLRQGRSIARGELAPPQDALPPDFPEPAGPVRGLHRGKLVALLQERGEALHPVANLRGGL